MENPLLISNSELWRNGPVEYFRTEPPVNWFLKVTCNSMDWQTPVADPKMATSLYCSCNLSSDFCGADDTHSYCPQCTTSSFHCIDIFNHIEDFCSQPPPPPEYLLSLGVIKPEFVFSSATPPPPSDEEYTPLENAVFRRLLCYSNLEKNCQKHSLHTFFIRNQFIRNLRSGSPKN